MSTVGDAYNNAMAEIFFASLECELIDRRKFKTRTEARMAGRVHVDRELVQPSATAQRARLPITNELRKGSASRKTSIPTRGSA